MEKLLKIIFSNEEWLIERILKYSKDQGYTKYTSTLQEAWRLSISGLSESLAGFINSGLSSLELRPNEDYTRDPAASFGIREAKLHRERGVDLGMFLGLMKYYRQTYQDLIRQSGLDPELEGHLRYIIERFFDRVELGFCTEWALISENEKTKELQSKNRALTNEKNKYLTILESIKDPVVLVDTEGKVDIVNNAWAKIFEDMAVPGAKYYSGKTADETIEGRIPWLAEELSCFMENNITEHSLEKAVETKYGVYHFQINFKQMLDVSDKYGGTVIILNDITGRKNAEKEREMIIEDLGEALQNVRTLKGLLPICARCKKIRDDEGYWNQIENYIQKHSDASFTHGLCPECLEKSYGHYEWYEKFREKAFNKSKSPD